MNRGNYVLVLEILYHLLTPRVFLGDVRLRQMYDTVLQELAVTCGKNKMIILFCVIISHL